MHLLIVEDQDALSESLSRRFVRRGFTVSVSIEPEDILARLRSGAISLCISDIDLSPCVSGLDIYRRVRAEGLATPFVFLSGHDESSEDMQAALALGAAGVFTKPTDFTVLLERVCSVLGIDQASVALATPK